MRHSSDGVPAYAAGAEPFDGPPVPGRQGGKWVLRTFYLAKSEKNRRTGKTEVLTG